jgi:hypothetical protein
LGEGGFSRSKGRQSTKQLVCQSVLPALADLFPQAAKIQATNCGVLLYQTATLGQQFFD